MLNSLYLKSTFSTCNLHLRIALGAEGIEPSRFFQSTDFLLIAIYIAKSVYLFLVLLLIRWTLPLSSSSDFDF